MNNLFTKITAIILAILMAGSVMVAGFLQNVQTV